MNYSSAQNLAERTHTQAPTLDAIKARMKATWEDGDYARFATYMEAGAIEILHSWRLPLGHVLREAPAYLDPGVRLASETLGDGISGGTDEVSGPNANYRLVGLSADVRLNGAHFVVGARTRWSDTDYFTVKDPVGAFELTSWDPYGLVTDDFFAHEWIGSYLVRTSAVPVPAAAWLLGSGLVVLAGTARRRHKH